MLSGSCLCGGVCYEISGPLSGALNCHCSMCRKAHGAAFRSRARVSVRDFRWVKGEELVTWYQSSPGVHRGFCGVCGSKLLSRFDRDPDSYGLPLGALDGDPGIKPAVHLFVAHKAPWFEITDALTQYAAAPQMIQASCLCRGVQFEIRGELSAASHCHCSMCRKAHGAAFGTYAAARADDFKVLEGAQWIRRYRSSPGIVRTFCARCGSTLQQLREATPNVLHIALGVLDDDPGVRPTHHIYVGSKAPWHDITDNLPRYAAGAGTTP